MQNFRTLGLAKEYYQATKDLKLADSSNEEVVGRSSATADEFRFKLIGRYH